MATHDPIEPIPDTAALLLQTNELNYHSLGAANKQEKEDEETGIDSEDRHKTTVQQTFVHLLKGYMGAGCLSLPWAISRLGYFWGMIAIFSVSAWSSYNCWTIVKLKRFIEKENAEVDDKASEASSVTTNTNVTYAAVGQFFYGSKFESYVAACVCIQQLAICTVFISFVGENLLAVMKHLDITFMATHAGVMTLELPVILGLSLIPNLKSLSPVMAVGTGLLILTFFSIGVIIQQIWPSRPTDPIEVDWSAAPLAVCAILYSYEGINLILPVESAMLEPQYFKIPFALAMISVAMILGSFSVICVLAFGNVTSGSVTAFLIEAFPDDPHILWWLMVANSAVSLSVLLTYPLQLFPALELLAPSFSRLLAQEDKDTGNEDDLSAFEPLPPLPEHGEADMDEWDDHQYELEEKRVEVEDEGEDAKEESSVAASAMTSIRSVMPEFTLPGDSPLLRILLVLMTYIIAVVVPNVQSLISLAGALAGSSTALLIPPILEMAWIDHLEIVKTNLEDGENEDRRWYKKLSMEKCKCIVLLGFGVIFFFVGTFASLADIIRIYLGGD